jgi:hypothetical protein
MEQFSQTNHELRTLEQRHPSICPLCDGIGFQIVESNGQSMARKCRCISQERVRSLQLRSGIPEIAWSDSLSLLKPKSLQEMAIVELFRECVNKRELPLLQSWIVPADKMDIETITLSFANDLIRLMGYRCLWLDCRTLARIPARTNPAQMDSFDAALAVSGDVVFISHYRNGLLKAKMQRWLEETVHHRLRHQKSTVFIGPKPEGYKAFQTLFQESALGMAIMKRFKTLDSGSPDLTTPHIGWLF